MANTAALLGTLLTKNADVNYYTQQQIYWSNKQEANQAKLAKQTQYEQNWQKAFDSAMDPDKDLECRGVKVSKGNTSEAQAEAYAKAKVKEYNEELSLELAALDVEYDSMKNMYDTLLEKMRADQASLKSATSNAAKDTGLLNQ